MGPTKDQGNRPEEPGWLRAEGMGVREGWADLGECPDTAELVSTSQGRGHSQGPLGIQWYIQRAKE